MPQPLLTRVYRRLGKRYATVFLAIELQAGFLVTAGTVALLSFYFDGTASEFLLIGAIAISLTAIAVMLALWRGRRQLGVIKCWIGGERDSESTTEARRAALGLPLALVRTQIGFPVFGVAVPSCIAAVIILELPGISLVPLTIASVLSITYGAILHYLTVEIGLRPVLVDINESAPPQEQIDIPAVPLRIRLMATLPMINVVTGFVVAALTAEGSESLGASVFIAIGVSTAIALELIVLLSRSILGPIEELRAATHRIAEGELKVEVPVTTADELGELATSFNQMVAGLRDRERIREAFGTYLDEDVASYILSEGFSEEGVELEVTVMFCDAKGFTSFASGKDAHDVVSALNQLFEVAVPIIASHGGHVDKFEGDGFMAVFGAPRRDGRHALQAVEAALEIDRRINRGGEGGGFELGVGINTGEVVAGSIGGGGRLNFSVIGDAVNIAARVEGVTRETGDGVLVTKRTAAALGDEVELQGRGPHALKGISEPVELFAPAGSDRVSGGERQEQAAAR